MTPETKSREVIDVQLSAAGWTVKSIAELLDLSASDEGVPPTVAKRRFGEDPKTIIEDLNRVLVA